MQNKFHPKTRADRVLYGQVVTELKSLFSLSDFTAKRYLLKSTFLPVLQQQPIIAHHEDAISWAETIVGQNMRR